MFSRYSGLKKYFVREKFKITIRNLRMTFDIEADLLLNYGVRSEWKNLKSFGKTNFHTRRFLFLVRNSDGDYLRIRYLDK